jgi:NitT/TauT family transport system permease protein
MAVTEPDTAGTGGGAADSAPLYDRDEARFARSRRIESVARWLLPFIVVTLAIWGWDQVVKVNEIPHYILPGPGLVVQTLIDDWSILYGSALVTLRITLFAIICAIIGGVGLAILFNQSKYAEMCFFPFAVILQVTPIVSIAPLIFIYIESKFVGLLLVAWIVAFFPLLANTTLGLKSADHNLRDLMTIYRASRWQRLIHLQLPSALPYFLGGLRIAGGLALIGAIVAEYVAGTGGVQSGLAFRILEAGYRLNIPRMFAALMLIAVIGVIIFMSTALLSHLLLRKWHESAVTRES